MEETKNNPAKLSRTKQPVKTEWGAHYMVLTYFQGDINSMVDEHFSRALSVTKNPQDLSRDNGVKDGIINNENHQASHGWGLPPHWNKPYGASSPLNLCASDGNPIVPTMDAYQPSILQGASPATAEFWPSSSGGDPRLTPVSRYPASDLHLAQEGMSDEKYGSLLGLLEQERCSRPVQDLLDSRSACLTGSSGMQNMSQRYPC
ncbi:transcription cofactor vestigial-like protein 1 [Thamnophis elegans]|uniref:transcription cofactor vestigial-like protein 1 n=1 Tax=Thamnophis elegans TaxID=35005 RepID=UPI0013778D6B|nr:transcription cofactor vestigial-like protein 1 [Thamnophis elegans]